MAQVILLRGGAGGVGSDDVTASKAQVLQGYKTVTTDSNDEVVEGAIPKRGNSVTASGFENKPTESKAIARIDEGFYSQNGINRPSISIPYAVLASSLGIDASKMLSTFTVAGTRGTIPVRGYKGPDSSEFSYYPPEGGYLTRVEEGYYHKGGGYKPYVIVPTAKVKQAVNYRPEKTLSDTNTCGEQGQIPIWAPSGSDVIMANNSHSGQGFAYDLPGVGRGIVVGIKNGSYIQGANYVFFPMQNLLPHNLRAGENFAGITGTMPDYSSGRTVFNIATFDGLLATGVANKAFFITRDFYALKLGNLGYTGIRDGGINLSFNTDYTPSRGRRVGFMLSQSNNLTPFRSIVVSYKVIGTLVGTPSIDLTPFVASVSSLQRQAIEVDGAKIDGFSQALTHKTVSHLWSQTTGQIVLDVSGVNEQAFLGFHAYTSVASDREKFIGDIRITKIDFLN